MTAQSMPTRLINSIVFHKFRLYLDGPPCTNFLQNMIYSSFSITKKNVTYAPLSVEVEFDIWGFLVGKRIRGTGRAVNFARLAV